MLDLSPETEALAVRLAETRQASVDLTIREALVAQYGSADAKSPTDASLRKSDLATRRALAIERYVREIAKLPDLDTRSVKQITDDLNPL